MRRLLVINPNTSESVTELLRTHAQAAAGPEVRVTAITARFGAAYIACEASYAVASHATLDAWAATLAQPGPWPDAVLIGCFGDPGLLALRESSATPVTGLAEAAFTVAARHGRFAIVTGGERWGPMLERLARMLSMDGSLAGIHTVAPTGAELSANPVWAHQLLAQACRDAAQRFNAQAVVLGGAGLAGMAAALQGVVAVPVIDSVIAGTQLALGSTLPVPGRVAPAFDVRWSSISAEMQKLALSPALPQR
jgi:Asp/Glu/hydantoin racemase